MWIRQARLYSDDLTDRTKLRDRSLVLLTGLPPKVCQRFGLQKLDSVRATFNRAELPAEHPAQREDAFCIRQVLFSLRELAGTYVRPLKVLPN